MNVTRRIVLMAFACGMSLGCGSDFINEEAEYQYLASLTNPTPKQWNRRKSLERAIVGKFDPGDQIILWGTIERLMPIGTWPGGQFNEEELAGIPVLPEKCRLRVIEDPQEPYEDIDYQDRFRRIAVEVAEGEHSGKRGELARYCLRRLGHW